MNSIYKMTLNTFLLINHLNEHEKNDNKQKKKKTKLK